MPLPGQIICKNLAHRAEAAAGLWINPNRDLSWREVANHCDTLNLFCQDFGAFSYHQQTGADVRFGAFPNVSDLKPSDLGTRGILAPAIMTSTIETTGIVESQDSVQIQKFDWIILTLPRQKELLQMLLDCAKCLLAAGGTVWLAGENKAGIKSADKLLKKHFGHVQKLDNARHCTLFEASAPNIDKPFNSAGYLETWIADSAQDFAGKKLEIASYPGVFAHGHLDAGSSLLLESLARQTITGSVLDFGCGSGVIGAHIATQPDTDVTFLDTSALALKACKETLARNNLEGTLLAADGLTGLETRYNWILSNPPIHSGVKTNNHLSMQLLTDVDKHLQPGGQLIIVANRHLPYEKWLGEKFKQVSELGVNQHFKVLCAS